MEKEKIILAILKGDKKITKYFYQKVEAVSIIEKINISNKKDLSIENLWVFNLIEAYLKLGTCSAETYYNNYTAIEIKVENLNAPIYFVKYENEYMIADKIIGHDRILSFPN